MVPAVLGCEATALRTGPAAVVAVVPVRPVGAGVQRQLPIDSVERTWDPRTWDPPIEGLPIEDPTPMLVAAPGVPFSDQKISSASCCGRYCVGRHRLSALP